MFGLGLTEIIIILVVALLVVGPKKLPELAKTLGRGLGEFRRTADEFKESIYKDEDSLADDRQKSEQQRQVSKIQHSEDHPASTSGESGEENSENETTLAEDRGENESPEAGS
ncbi:MAG: twin-arginine translocase TatA/TatE family subunit [Deltaproteobacteria bacterium]|nr:twin-arginine translocase TatA/TatE family subunit [Deltaproteobacteria bacterium]